MKRLLKIVLIVFGVLVALIFAAAIILPMVVNPNQYKDEIEAFVEQKTGREFTLKGDIELSVFPWLGVELGPAKLANAKGFPDRPMLSFKHAEVSVRLLPLLSGEIKIGTIALDGVRVRLAINESGKSNWQSLVKNLTSGKKKEKAPAEPKNKQKKGQGGLPLSDLSIDSIEITDAAITFRNAPANTVYKLRDVDLSTGHLELGKPFPVQLDFTFKSNNPAVTVETQLSATIDANVAEKIYRISDLSVQVQASGEAIPGGEQQLTLTADGKVNLKSGHLRISQLKLQAAGVTVTGQVEGSDILGQPSFAGRLTVHQFNPKAAMRKLGIEPPKTSDENALTSASLKTQFQATLESVTLDPLVIHLDKSTLKGTASVDNFASPDITFDMTLDQLKVGRYLPPSPDKKGDQGGDKAVAQKKKPASGPLVISLEPLKAFNVDGMLTVGELTVAGIHFSQAKLAVTAHNGVLRIQPLGAQLYQGKLHIESNINAAGKAPSYSIQGELSGLHLGPLLQDLIGQKKLSALANLTLDLTTSGDTLKEIKRNLEGTISFTLRNGAFRGFDLAGILALAAERLFGSTLAANTNGKTPFSKFTATFSVEDGILRGGGLTLDTAYAQLTGEGTFNLVTNQLDYVFKATIPKDAEGEILEELAGYTIPIHVSGNLLSPSYSLDLSGMLKNIAQQKLAEEKAELKKEIHKEIKQQKQELRNEIQEGLRDLLN